MSAAATPTLLPCPFCASDPCAQEPISYLDPDGEATHIVACHNPKCPAPPAAFGSTPEEAAAKWNTRSGGAVSATAPAWPLSGKTHSGPVRHPFSADELHQLIAASGLLACDEPKAKDEFARRINALKTLYEGMFRAFGDLQADVYRGPYPGTASAPEAGGHGDR